MRCNQRIFNECRTLPRVDLEAEEVEETALEAGDD